MIFLKKKKMMKAFWMEIEGLLRQDVRVQENIP